MEIVGFTRQDTDTVFEIQRAAYRPLYEKYRDEDTSPYTESRETVLQKYTKPGTRGYLFLENGVAVGTVRIILDTVGKSAKVSALAVRPEYQGRGIAQQALLKIERIHSDVEKWHLDTILEEAANCHLYEKLGYKRTGKLQAVNEKLTLAFYEKIIK